MTMVCADLELVEKEYFSLTYRDVNNMKVRLRDTFLYLQKNEKINFFSNKKVLA